MKRRRAAKANNAERLERAAGLLIDRAIELLETAPAEGTLVKWAGTDERGEKRTVEYSLSDLAAALERLSRASQGRETADDPLAALLRRLDDEAAAQ